MTERQLIGTENRSSVIPRIYIDPGIVDAPYNLFFDGDKYSKLLLSNGVKPVFMENQSVAFYRDSGEPFTFASVSRTTGNLMVNCDYIWDRLGEGAKVNKVIVHEMKHIIDWNSRLGFAWKSMRLLAFDAAFVGAASFYLANNGVPGALSFDKFEMMGLSCMMGVYGMLMDLTCGPVEIRADSFAKKMNKLPEWQGVLKLTAKEEFAGLKSGTTLVEG